MSAQRLRLWVAFGLLLSCGGATWLVWRAEASANLRGAQAVGTQPMTPAAPGPQHSAAAPRADFAWGPSPFAPGPARLETPPADAGAAAAPAPPAEASELRAQVHLFELLRSRAEYDAALTHVAGEIRDRIEPALLLGEISPTEALLLTGAVLEILEPDNDARAELLADWGEQHLPPVSAEEGDTDGHG